MAKLYAADCKLCILWLLGLALPFANRYIYGLGLYMRAQDFRIR